MKGGEKWRDGRGKKGGEDTREVEKKLLKDFLMVTVIARTAVDTSTLWYLGYGKSRLKDLNAAELLVVITLCF